MVLGSSESMRAHGGCLLDGLMLTPSARLSSVAEREELGEVDVGPCQPGRMP